MCGIVGAIAQRDVELILVEGLRRLEYRGYDSAGVVIMDEGQHLQRARAMGKVQELADKLESNPLPGGLGIAHTRWATHGEPSERNAHPHVSGRVAVVHNGIIENHASLRKELTAAGYAFSSDTDTEVIAHLIESLLDSHATLFAAVSAAIKRFEGAYGLAVVCSDYPDELIAARSGSPLVIGIGLGEHFIASDVAALLPVTDRFVFLEEGDVARVRRLGIDIQDHQGVAVERKMRISELKADAVERGEYRHYMLKEIYDQPQAIANALEGRLGADHVLDGTFGPRADELLSQVQGVHIVACGTSYHSSLVARYWIETLARIPCVVEIASEYRYRQPVVQANRLFVTISQSGETADTLAALRMSKELGYLGSLTICNVPESSLVRESDMCLMTRAGPEIGVASTKAFTTQLVGLLLLAASLQKYATGQSPAEVVKQLHGVVSVVNETLKLDDEIRVLSQAFMDKHHALFLGRGELYPVAMEGALKLKEISYIHAEAYAAGELKHGPLALVDDDMPVIAVAPNNQLLEKLKSNLEEVRARGGKLFVFAAASSGFKTEEGVTVVNVPHAETYMEPLVYTLPLQLLSYHVAVLKGTDVDQPRNLAKSVTVE